MTYSKEIINEYLSKVRAAHEDILNLYNDSLYEDNWDDHIIKKFEMLLNEYTESLKVLDELVPQIPWKNPNNKVVWLKKYNEVIKTDEKSFRLVKIRHDAYKTYRGFRKILISRLNHVMGWASSSIDEKVFEYFNDNCANVPLYSNKDEEGNITYRQDPNLFNWVRSQLGSLTDDINRKLRIQPQYDQNDVLDIFRYYVEARKGVFAIFNMLTSTSDVNGYDKWHNYLEGYITNDTRVVNDKNLKTMYSNTKIDDSFIPKDDYQQIMDDRTWNQKGIYESWFDAELVKYNQQIKDRRKTDKNITKINMIERNSNACKVTTDGQHVYANAKFYPGDIIEIVPTRTIDKSSLYSKDMREIAFEVVPNEEWVVPFGYCQYYDLAETEEPNCDFLWDPAKRVIVIKAINKIGKYEKLILNNIK